MEILPSRAEGHLIVAAVRVLIHKGKRPPMAEEIGSLLDLSREHILHLLRGLESRRIVRAIESPFETRFDIDEPAGLEGLPESSSGPDMKREIHDFHKQTESRQKKIEEMMRDGDPESRSRRKAEAIEKEFQRFRSQKSRSPFREKKE